MKTKNLLIAFAITSFAISFTACKKNDKSSDTTDTSTEIQVQSDDQARVSNETDAIDNEANAVLDNMGGAYNERPAYNSNDQHRPLDFLPLPCDATVTTNFDVNPRTITIDYNGSDCSGTRTRTRVGKVVLSFAPDFKWKNAEAELTVDIQNLKITRKRDNKSITINGVRKIKNVTGGLLKNLASRGTIIHTIKSDGMEVTFDNGTKRTWQIARQRTFTYDNGVKVSISGIAPAIIGDNVAEWGTNRFGHAFTTAITQALVMKQSCDFRLVSGQIRHIGNVGTTTTTFGLDATGEIVTDCPVGPYYYEIVWTGNNGNMFTYIGAY